MSRSKVLPAFILALIAPLSTSAAGSGGQARLSHHARTPCSPAHTKKLSETPVEPLRTERFLGQALGASAPSGAETEEAREAEKPLAARASEKPLPSAHINLSIPALPLFSSSTRQLNLIDKTYLDVFAILQASNSCSRFFGGPRIATDVLNSLYPRLQPEAIEHHVGILMTGPITSVTDAQTGASYRLFRKVVVNLAGPFYRSVNNRSQTFFKKVGDYSANTREARASMLLHELGHLFPGASGDWLLPDDGGDQLQSDANTNTIMENCSQQIRALSQKHDAPPSLEAATAAAR